MASAVKGNGSALKYLHCLLQGKDLKSTILSNCIDKELINQHFGAIGLPSWDLKFTTKKSGYLNRLSHRTCALWIRDDLQKITIDAGSECPEYPEQRDAFSTAYVKNDKKYLLRADLQKGIWRDLHVIIMLKQSGRQEQQAPLNLQSHFHQYLSSDVNLWLGELYKHEKLAKVIDSIESSFTVPFGMFTETGRARYQSGINHADRQSNQLYGAVKQYGVTMKNESPPTDLAKQHYWNALEQQHHLLLDIVRQDAPMAEDFGEGKNPWTQAVLQAARAAYIHVCPRQTPRQLQAFAIGLKVLSAKSTTKKTSTRNPATV